MQPKEPRAGVCSNRTRLLAGPNRRRKKKATPLFSRIFDFLVILVYVSFSLLPPLPTPPPTLKYRSTLPSLNDSAVSPEPSRVRIRHSLAGAGLPYLPALPSPSLEVHGSIFFPKPTSPTPSQLHVSTSPRNRPRPSPFASPS